MMPFGWPDCQTWYKLFTDWGSFLGGLLALAAGFLAYWGARKAAADQVAATKGAATEQVAAAEKQVAAAVRQIEVLLAKDRLQARGMQIAISPDLLELEVLLDRSAAIINQEWMKTLSVRWSDMDGLIKSAKIEIPPMLQRNIDHLYLIEEYGADLLQLVSIILQFNSLIDKLAVGEAASPGSFKAPDARQSLAGHLEALRLCYGGVADKASKVEVAPVTPPSPPVS